ncbi:MAG: HNH endonuclease [Thermovirgaceae bacterium]|jgi:putative restriction endonuclease
MRAYIGVTDSDWYKTLSQIPELEEVNFWQPGGRRRFKALNQGELFLFKLHSPNNFIVGGGVFAYSTILPASLAWDTFGRSNGADSFAQMRQRIAKYRKTKEDPFNDYSIGCILLTQPFFFPKTRWAPVPDDWSLNIVQGKTYDLKTEPGSTVFNELRISQLFSNGNLFNTARVGRGEPVGVEKYGKATLITPRLGQGAFRIMVTDAYERRCAVTNEKVLPVLEAAHIKPYGAGGEHKLDNGLLLRSDLHLLFDRGYVTVTPDHHLEVSRKIREEFENGRDYYALQGKKIWIPTEPSKCPGILNLTWHNENIFRG